MFKNNRRFSLKGNGTPSSSNPKSLTKLFPPSTVGEHQRQQTFTSSRSSQSPNSTFTNNFSRYHRNRHMSQSLMSICGSPTAQYKYTNTEDIPIRPSLMETRSLKPIPAHSLSPCHTYDFHHSHESVDRQRGYTQTSYYGRPSPPVPHPHYLGHVQYHPSQQYHLHQPPHFFGTSLDSPPYFTGFPAVPINHNATISMSGGEGEVRGRHKSNINITPSDRHTMYNEPNRNERRNEIQFNASDQSTSLPFPRNLNDSPADQTAFRMRKEQCSDSTTYIDNSQANMSLFSRREAHDGDDEAHRQQQAYYRLSHQVFRSPGGISPSYARTGHYPFPNAPPGSGPVPLLSYSVHPLFVSKMQELRASLHSLGFTPRVCTDLWRSYKRSFWDLLPFTLALLFLIPEGMNRAFANDLRARIVDQSMHGGQSDTKENR